MEGITIDFMIIMEECLSTTPIADKISNWKPILPGADRICIIFVEVPQCDKTGLDRLKQFEIKRVKSNLASASFQDRITPVLFCDCNREVYYLYLNFLCSRGFLLKNLMWFCVVLGL